MRDSAGQVRLARCDDVVIPGIGKTVGTKRLLVQKQITAPVLVVAALREWP